MHMNSMLNPTHGMKHILKNSSVESFQKVCVGAKTIKYSVNSHAGNFHAMKFFYLYLHMCKKTKFPTHAGM